MAGDQYYGNITQNFNANNIITEGIGSVNSLKTQQFGAADRYNFLQERLISPTYTVTMRDFVDINADGTFTYISHYPFLIGWLRKITCHVHGAAQTSGHANLQMPTGVLASQFDTTIAGYREVTPFGAQGFVGVDSMGGVILPLLTWDSTMTFSGTGMTSYEQLPQFVMEFEVQQLA